MLLTWGMGTGLNTVLGLAPLGWWRFGVGITVTGSGVSSWLDQSGNGRTLSQATDTNRPALLANNIIDFDGVDNFLSTVSVDLSGTSLITTYALMRAALVAANSTLIVEHTANAQTNDSFLDYITQNSRTVRALTFSTGGAVSNENETSTSFTDDAFFVFSATHNRTLGAVPQNFPQINNGSSASTSSLNVTGAFPAAGQLFVGSRGGTTLFLDGAIKELIIYPTAHTASQRQGVIRYLQQVGQV